MSRNATTASAMLKPLPQEVPQKMSRDQREYGASNRTRGDLKKLFLVLLPSFLG